MKTRIIAKILGVGGTVVLLMIPLLMIRGLIFERSRFRDQAKNDIANSWTGAQNLMGPVLSVPYDFVQYKPGKEGEPAQPVAANGEALLLPKQLNVVATLRTETRRRGLYEVPVYFAALDIRGSFDTSTLDTIARERQSVEFGTAMLHVSLGDNRGIATSPVVRWDGAPRAIVPGSGLPIQPSGVRINLGSLPDTDHEHAFDIQLELRGMESLSFVPTGEDVNVQVDAAWPHPSFTGRFLPVEYEVLEDRFTAEWRISHLASGVDEVRKVLMEEQSGLIQNHTFGVSLVNTVDVYQQAMRSAKYGWLFIVLTFTAFFLIEFCRKLQLHPLQYLMVGLALSVFFLLLLSLSEHMPFGIAYLVASVACVGLVGTYLSSAMSNASNGLGVVAILGSLYGMLYAILLSEDNALLMGSLLLFFALAAVMLVTRKIDWYRLTGTTAGGPTIPTPALNE